MEIMIFSQKFRSLNVLRHGMHGTALNVRGFLEGYLTGMCSSAELDLHTYFTDDQRSPKDRAEITLGVAWALCSQKLVLNGAKEKATMDDQKQAYI